MKSYCLNHLIGNPECLQCTPDDYNSHCIMYREVHVEDFEVERVEDIMANTKLFMLGFQLEKLEGRVV